MKQIKIFISIFVTLISFIFSGCGDDEKRVTNSTIENHIQADAGQNQTVLFGEEVLLDASGSTKNYSSDVLTYSWEEGGKLLSSDSKFVLKGLTVGNHIVTLTIKDEHGFTSIDTVSIQVNENYVDENIANAGQNQTVLYGEEVLLDASKSSVSLAEIVSFTWKEGSTLLSTEESFKMDSLSIGRHTFSLTVEDANGVTASDTVNVTVITKAAEQYYSEFVHTVENISTGGETTSFIALGNYLYALDNKVGLQVIDISDASSPQIVNRVDTYGVINGKITISGNNIYIACNEGLYVYDISQPIIPKIIGKIDISTATFTGESNVNGVVENVIVSGQYAYIAYGDYGVAIVDTNKTTLSNTITESYIVDTNRLHIANRDIITEDYLYDFRISKDNKYAYLADGDKGFKVVDISELNDTNKTSSEILSYVEVDNYAKSMAVKDNIVYIVDGWKDIKVIDVSDPVSSKVVNTLSTNHTSYDSINDMEVFGNNLYYTDSEGVTVFDITIPSSPILKGTVYTGYSDELSLSGNYAFVTDVNGMINEVAVSMPFPHITGSIDISNTAEKILVSNYYVYIASGFNGLNIVDISEHIKKFEGNDILDTSAPSTVAITKNIDVDSSVQDVVVKGSYAYLAAGDKGLVIIDISNLSLISEKKSLNTNGVATGIDILDDYVYIANGEKGLTIVNILDINNPVITGSIDTDGVAKEILVSGNYVYMADYDGGLKIIDVSNKSQPKVVGNLTTDGLAQDITLVDNLIYLADDLKGLKIVDVSNPTSPTLLKSLDSHDALGVVVSGNYLFLADDEKGLKVIDISYPLYPTILGVVTTTGSVYDVTVSGDFVYIVDSLGVQIVDFSKLAK